MSCRRGVALLAAVAVAGTAGPALAQDEDPPEEPEVPVQEEEAEPPVEGEGTFEEVVPEEGDEPAEEAVGDDEEVVEEEGGGVDVQPPSTTLTAPARTAVRTLLVKGLAAQVTCAEPCRVVVSLRRGGARGPVVGTRTVRIRSAGGRVPFRLRVTGGRARSTLRATRARQLEVTAAAGDAAGNRRLVTRQVALRR